MFNRPSGKGEPLPERMMIIPFDIGCYEIRSLMARMAHRLQIFRVDEKSFSARGVRVMERGKNLIH